jgi:hypothetical protein
VLGKALNGIRFGGCHFTYIESAGNSEGEVQRIERRKELESGRRSILILAKRASDLLVWNIVIAELLCEI